MRTGVIAVLALLVFAASLIAAAATDSSAGRSGAGGGQSPAANDSGGAAGGGGAAIANENTSEGRLVTAPSPIRATERTKAEKTYENGTKIISVTDAGRFGLNKTVTIVNSTYKTMEIDTPKGGITIEVTGRGPADVTRNSEFVRRISEGFENYTTIEKIVMDPVSNKVGAKMRDEAGNETETEIPETLRTRVRARIQEMPVNITINGETKDVVLVSKGMTVVTKERVEVENETVYLVTAKVRKKIHILPENASETAKLKANFHVVKAIELTEKDGSVVYAIKGKQIGKILGLFQTELDVDSDVDTETGVVKNVRKPWWAFLVF